MEIEINLPKLTWYQQEVIDAPHRTKILMFSRQIGKSHLARDIIINDLIQHPKTGAGIRICYITPELRLANKFYDEIINTLPDILIEKKNKKDLYILTRTGGELRFYSGNTLTAIRGNTFDKYIIDEAAHIIDLHELQSVILDPTLSTSKIKERMFISTPCGFDHFYSLFLKGQEENKEYISFKRDVYVSPWMSEEDIQLRRDESTEAKFNQEYLMIPVSDGSPFGEISDEIVSDKLSSSPTIVYAVDLASTQDYTVITGLDHRNRLTYFKRFQKGWNETIDILKKLDKKIPLVIDSTGVGKPIYEQLVKDRGNCIPFLFTNESKTKIVLHLVMLTENKTITINDVIKQEMSTLESSETSTGLTKYYARSGYHDDSVMSIAMAAYFQPKFLNGSNPFWKNNP